MVTIPAVLLIGSGAPRAQDDKSWSWVSGLINLQQASTVAVAAYNAGPEPATYHLEIWRVVPSEVVFAVGPGTLAPGSRASTSGPVCGPNVESCPSQVIVRMSSSSAATVPSARIWHTDGSFRQFLTAGDFRLVSPDGGDAAASVGALREVEALGGQVDALEGKLDALGDPVGALTLELERTRQALQRRIKRVQKRVMKRLRRIQRAVR